MANSLSSEFARSVLATPEGTADAYQLTISKRSHLQAMAAVFWHVHATFPHQLSESLLASIETTTTTANTPGFSKQSKCSPNAVTRVQESHLRSRELQTSSENSQMTTREEDLTSSPPPPPVSRSGCGGPYVIRLRGLPWESTVRDLEEFLSPVRGKNHGPLSEDVCCIMYSLPVGVLRRCATNKQCQGRCTGEAYVELVSNDMREEALAKLHGNLLGRRWIEIFKATSNEFHEAKERKWCSPTTTLTSRDETTEPHWRENWQQCDVLRW